MRRAPLLLALLLTLSCGRSPRPHGGPIVLITLDSLRADVVGGIGGAPGLMPNLEGLLRDADWGGRGIAPSSAGGPAMASLFTGLRPWQHQILRAGGTRLPAALHTLPEALKAAGYETAGFTGSAEYDKRHGYAQGFDLLTRLGQGEEAAARLARLDGGRRFVWIHIPQPQAPYVQRKRLAARLGKDRPARLPARVLPFQLEPYFDPAVPLPPARREAFWALYRINAAWADERLGRLLDSLRSSGQWDRTLLVVTSNHGEEFGERRQIRSGGNLGRQLLEVPLAVKLPAGSRRKIVPPEARRVGTARLWATVVETAGGEVPPAVAPSLFREGPAGVLSELYLRNGTNQFSLVEGDHQLLWESRFAPPDPEYYAALRQELVRGKGLKTGTRRPSEAILADLRDGFLAAPPLTGRGRPRLTLERWGERGSEPVNDPRRREEMARRLASAWGNFVPHEVPPGEEAREWYTGEPP